MIADSFMEVESRQEILPIMNELQEALHQIPSKFVDIDTSYKEIDQESLADFQNRMSSLSDQQLESDLSEVFEVLALYLLIKDRFGDAADWNLKLELGVRLAKQMERILFVLTSDS